MKKILFALLFNASEMKYIFVSRVAGVIQPIKKPKQARARYRDKDVGGNNAGITEDVLHHINTAT